MTIPTELKQIAAGAKGAEDLAERLDGFPLLADLSFPEKRMLAQHMLIYRAEPQIFIFREGDPGNFLCFVLEGHIDLIKSGGTATEAHLGTVSAGKTVGEMALIDGEPRSAGARCRDAVEVALLTKESFERLAASHAPQALKFMGKLAKLVSQRLRQTTAQLLDHLAD